MKKINFLVLVLVLAVPVALQAKKYNLLSPNSKLSVEIDYDQELHFSVMLGGDIFLENGDIDLSFDNKQLIAGSKLLKRSKGSVDDIVVPVIKNRSAKFIDHYNSLTLSFSNDVDVEFRAYDDGVAYRFITAHKGIVEVNELAAYQFSEDLNAWTSPIDGFASSYEPSYKEFSINAFKGQQSYLPMLLAASSGVKMLITDADVYDYPHTFLKSEGDRKLIAQYPPYPLEVKMKRDRSSVITKGADYIAKTDGTRKFPWRVMILTEKDAQLVQSNLVFLLSRPIEQENTDWIKPGRVSWEWWNASNLHGVDFEAGFNTESYKYYIDFAAENGLEYIILDEGWSVSTLDLSKPNPTLDLEELIAYGKEREVDIILWATWRALEEQWSVLDNFREWGVAGIKLDFMDRADQWMVNFYEKVAKLCFERELIVDFHGAFKPSGLRRAYPNVLSYEGVRGLENCKWDKTVTPTHNVTLPFLRMVCGPMDYTPGAMRNYQPKNFTPNFTRPGSQGTRCHQLALFVAFESGLQMLADSPSNYKTEKESSDIMASIPVSWDETVIIEAEVGELFVVARRSGDRWFIGALTGDKGRDVDIDLSFLSSGDHKAIIMEDGKNANNFAEDYSRRELVVNRDRPLKLKLATGGGSVVTIL